MQQVLLYFCILFIAVQAAVILVPFILRKRDLFNAWTLFLVGAITFVGLSGISAATAPFHYAEYTSMDYTLFMIGVVVFFLSLTIVYSFVKFPAKIAANRFRKWPPLTPTVLLASVFLGFILSIGQISPIQIQGVGQLMGMVGKNGVIIMTVCAFTLWYRQPLNPVFIVLLVLVFIYSFGLSMLAGSGRRDMVAVLAAIPIVLYWYRFRYMNPVKTTCTLLALVIPAILVVNAYSTIRHELQKETDKSLSTLASAAMKIPSRMLSTSTASQMLGQNAAEASLLAIHVYQTERWAGFEQEPFFTVKYVLLNPVPRAFWRDKPEGLGITLPRRTGKQGGKESWGPGIVGHGFHEGGLLMLLFYGVLVGLLIKCFDQLLYQHPDNPYILSIMIASTGQIIGWTRGDIGTFTVHIIAGFIAVWFVVRVLRLFFGTQWTMSFNQRLAAAQ